MFPAQNSLNSFSSHPINWTTSSLHRRLLQVVYALKDIQPGEEIVVTYTRLDADSQTRQEQLQDRFVASHKPLGQPPCQMVIQSDPSQNWENQFWVFSARRACIMLVALN